MVKVFDEWHHVTVTYDEHVKEPFFKTKSGKFIFLFECDEIRKEPFLQIEPH